MTTRSFIIILLLALFGVYSFLLYCSTFPGSSYTQSPPNLTKAETHTQDNLTRHVSTLASSIGARNDEHPKAYKKSATYILKELKGMGYSPVEHPLKTAGGTWPIIEVTLTGQSRATDIVLFAAHYDSCHTTPGADDNASGVAAQLELARLLHKTTPEHTIRLVFVPNEEPPHFKTKDMGSYAYAKLARARKDDIKIMYSLEMLGYFTDEEDSQHYPSVLSTVYPDTGNFIAMVSLLDYRAQTQQSMRIFRNHAKLASEGFTGPDFVPGIDYSDHWSFWVHNYPAIMITDTSFFRTPHYHKATDTPDTLDYKRLTHITHALAKLAVDYDTTK